MDEYVSKEAFIKRFEGMNMSWVITMLDIFKEFPAADVEPVRHGRWMQVSSNPWDGARCSACNRFYSGSEWGDRYCKACGAKMDLEE